MNLQILYDKLKISCIVINKIKISNNGENIDLYIYLQRAKTPYYIKNLSKNKYEKYSGTLTKKRMKDMNEKSIEEKL